MALTREFLSEQGISEDVINKIMAEVGKDITKGQKLDEVQAQLEAAQAQVKDLNDQITDRDKQLTTLKKSAGDNEELKNQLQKLQDDNAAAKNVYEDKIQAITKNSKLEMALIQAGARNPKAVKALLNSDAISVDGENLIGLDDQLKALQESDAYLFQTKEDKTKVKITTGGNPDGHLSSAKSLDDLTLAEQMELYRNDPTKYKELSNK